MILIGYDDSSDARAAVARAATLMPGYRVVVLVVCEPGREAAAEACAGAGVRLAREVGADATARVQVRSGTIAQMILAEAELLECRAIVLGRHGAGAASEPARACGRPLVGGVTREVVAGARQAVLVVAASGSGPSRDAGALAVGAAT